MGTDRDAARAAKEHLRAHLHGLEGVGGFGLGRRDDGYVITVTVARDEACAQVPGEYEGVAVEVRVSGEVRLLPAAEGAPATSAAADDAGPVDPPDLAAHRPALRPAPGPRER